MVCEVYKIVLLRGSLLLGLFFTFQLTLFAVDSKLKNVLLLNSYHQGFAWTDSLTTGITQVFKETGEVNCYIAYLNSKQFGKSNFESERNLIQNKYKSVSFSGILVTDNDALDFAFQYRDSLFPEIPIVFAGISNPEAYPLKDSGFWGFKETSNTDSISDLVTMLLPKVKKLLCITDSTTTGRLYREALMRQQLRMPGLSIVFPKEIEFESICAEVQSHSGFDAIFYVAVNQDKNGNPVDDLGLLEQVGRLSKVPVFASDPGYIGKGVLGGVYQSGVIQGREAARLLVRLMDSPDQLPSDQIFYSQRGYFFDSQLLKYFRIDPDKLPKQSIVANQQFSLNYSRIGIVIGILVFAVVILSVVNRRRLTKQRRSDLQLKQIEIQKNELQETYLKLERAIGDLENTNERLQEANQSLFEAKKKAEESDRLKSAFLANVSHEIRTPLNSIVGFSSLLCDSDLDEATRAMYAGLVESNTESLLVLIDEIIDLSKIEAQQLTLKNQEFSVNALMMELYQTFSHTHQNKAVQLQIKSIVPQTELFLYADRVRVKQIFINLLSNAFKFTESGSIGMGYFQNEEGEVVLFVEDTGIGIRTEDYQNVFQRFRKLDLNTGKVYRGTGLGLAITQKLVELLGGRIWLISEPGKGTTFFFTLNGCSLKQEIML